MAFEHHAIHGHFVAGYHTQRVTDFHLIERHDLVSAGRDLPRSGRREIQQRLNCAAGSTAGAEFQHLPEQHQNDNHGSSLKVDRDLAVMLHRMREESRSKHRHCAEKERCAHADCDQCEHVPVPREDRAPAAPEEWPASPSDDRNRECKLDPPRRMTVRPRLIRERRDQMRHRENEHGKRQRRSDPKAAGHIAKLGVFVIVATRRHRFESHAALRAIAGMILLHLWVHRACIDGLARHPRRIPLQRHSACRTIARLVRLHAGAHRAEVFRVGGRLHFRVTVAVFFVSAATTAGSFRGRSLGEKRLPAVLAAKIERLPIALGVQRGGLIHSHVANRVFGHIKLLPEPNANHGFDLRRAIFWIASFSGPTAFSSRSLRINSSLVLAGSFSNSFESLPISCVGFCGFCFIRVLSNEVSRRELAPVVSLGDSVISRS